MKSPSPFLLKGHELVHSQILTHLIKDVLPIVFPILVKKCKKLGDIYPVVVGGLALQECASASTKAASLIKDLFSEDVDIKFVMEHPDDIDQDALDKIRKSILKKIIVLLKKYAKSIQSQDMVIDIRESYVLLNHKLPMISNKRVFSIDIDYIELNGKNTVSIMDMGITTPHNTDHFYSYRKLIKDPKSSSPDQPIPTKVVNNISYATCNFVYYDTVRMMMDRTHFFEKTKSMFALIKVSRYIIKFMCLYVMLKEKSKKKNVDVRIMELYHKIHRLLKETQGKQFTDLKEARKILYATPMVNNINKLINKVVRVTNIDDLVQIVDKHNTP